MPQSMIHRILTALAALLLLVGCAAPMRAVRVEGARFVHDGTSERFIAWGHNYGHPNQLLCDFWIDHFDQVERDFRYMKRDLGANVVRVHLDLPAFMESPTKVSPRQLRQLRKLVDLAERERIYLDITGLACYRVADVPKWYDALDEKNRWQVQARFWQAVARECRHSPAVFCYDLINEPISPGDKRTDGKWYTGEFGGFDFIQFITLDPAGRDRTQIAVDWIRAMTAAIRREDRRHMITVGLLPWSKQWGHLGGFVPEIVAKELDFISVHIYPESGKVNEAIEGLRKFEVGKPVVIEETFPLTCSIEELREFIEQTRGEVAGYLGHFGGETIAELEAGQRTDISKALWRAWLVLFREEVK